MKDLIKLIAKRAPWPVALALTCVVGYLVWADEAARHSVLMNLTTAGAELDWPITVLISVLAWIGNQVHTRLDALTSEIKGLHATLTEFDRDLREDIQETKSLSAAQYHGLSERIAVVEERCDTYEHHRAKTCPFHSAKKEP